MRPLIRFIIPVIVLISCGNPAEVNVPVSTQVKKNTDSTITGVPLPYTPENIDTDSLLPPTVIPAKAPVIENAYLNVRIAAPPFVTAANQNPTIKTPGLEGVSLPTEGSVDYSFTRSHNPKPVPALPPSFKDKASYNIQYIDVDQGLSSSYIMCMEEDQRGNLWFGTWQMGVSMYNGRYFTHFSEEDGLSSNYIWSICEDDEGNIWFGTDGSGVCKYDGHAFTQYDDKSGIPDLVIRDIILDPNGDLWMATREAGVTRYDGEKWYTYGIDQGLPSNEANDLHRTKSGQILIATQGGFCVYDGIGFTRYTAEDGLPTDEIETVFEDSKGNIWLGSYGYGACKFDGNNFYQYTTEQGLTSDYIEQIIEDGYGNLWFATSDGGLTMYDRQQFTHITENEGLSNDNIYCIHEDTHGNLWFGSYGAGVNKYSERSFQNFTETSGLPVPIIRNIMEDADGNLWFAHTQGVSKYVDGMFHHYNEESGLASDFVRAMHQDRNGDIWFAHDVGGVTKFDGVNFYHYQEDQGMYASQVFVIHEDSEGNLYFGTNGEGVIMFGTNGSIKQFLFEDDDAQNLVRAISEDAEGNIWFGTNGGGAYIWDGENITIYKKELSENPTILSFLPTKDNKMWVGTEHSGAFLLSREKSRKFSTKNGLTNDIIWSMSEDYEGNIWIGTERGLNMISHSDTTDYMITKFGKLDGLKGVDFFPNSACLDHKSRFWWGSGKALIMLDLKKYETIMEAPKVTINDVELHQSFIDFRALADSNNTDKKLSLESDKSYDLSDVSFDGVVPFTNCPNNLELPYELNHVTFHFSAIDWAAPHKLRYQYKMEGLDKDWSPLVKDDKAVYNSIPEGNYTFKIRAIGEAQLWSETLVYPLVIRAPWYRTTLAYIGYVVGAILLVLLTMYLRTRQLIEQRKTLEKTVQQRTLEVVHQKELVEIKNKEITDSITYAKRIQEAILPSPASFKKVLQESFILYKPKDIVAGDFYWMEYSDNKVLIAAADCTGHGVPGAMVSVVCNNALNRAVREFGLSKPGDILNKVRDLVIESFASGKKDIKDGMDIALLSFDLKTNEVEYAGANNSLYIVSDGELNTVEADKQPIGKYAVNKDFTNYTVNTKKGDTLYICTDGYMDQFGGPKGKKFKYVPFMDMLVKINDKSMVAQKEFIDEVFENWRGDFEQVDDICVIGVRL